MSTIKILVYNFDKRSLTNAYWKGFFSCRIFCVNHFYFSSFSYYGSVR